MNAGQVTVEAGGERIVIAWTSDPVFRAECADGTPIDVAAEAALERMTGVPSALRRAVAVADVLTRYAELGGDFHDDMDDRMESGAWIVTNRFDMDGALDHVRALGIHESYPIAIFGVSDLPNALNAMVNLAHHDLRVAIAEKFTVPEAVEAATRALRDLAIRERDSVAPDLLDKHGSPQSNRARASGLYQRLYAEVCAEKAAAAG